MINKKLDLIIIGYNESQNLQKCFESALKACKGLKDSLNMESDIMYVDSYSTDNSVEIARAMCIKTCFSPQLYHSCSNARTAGFLLTENEFIMFLDGDMEIKQGWLTDGVKFLIDNPDAGAVAGIRDEMRLYKNKFYEIKNYNNVKDNVNPISNDAGGAFMFRRAALESIGGFDPEVSSEEDYVAYCELKTRGWESYRINKPMITHWDTKIKNIESGINHLLINKKALVPGIIFKYALFNTNWAWLYMLKFKKYIILHTAWLSITVTSMILYYLKITTLNQVAAWFIVITFFYLFHISAEKKDLTRTLAALFLRTAYVFNMLIAFAFNYPKINFNTQTNKDYIKNVYKINGLDFPS